MSTKHKSLMVIILIFIGSTNDMSRANDVKNTVYCITGTNLASSEKNSDMVENEDSSEKIISSDVADKRSKDDSSASVKISEARLFMKKNNVAKAIVCYKNAINSEADKDKKAGYCYELALVIYEQKDYSEVRNFARQAIMLKPDWGKPYILIGKIYAASAKLIGESDLQQRLVYCLAVDQFIYAKAVDPEVSAEASKEIAQYSQYFPNKEDALFENINTGSTYKVGGWINDTTIVRLR